jgi:hypothetical protein
MTRTTPTFGRDHDRGQLMWRVLALTSGASTGWRARKLRWGSCITPPEHLIRVADWRKISVARIPQGSILHPLWRGGRRPRLGNAALARRASPFRPAGFSGSLSAVALSESQRPAGTPPSPRARSLRCPPALAAWRCSRRSRALISIAGGVSGVCRGLPETVPATGSNCRNRDCRRGCYPNGSTPRMWGIGSPSTRCLFRC